MGRKAAPPKGGEDQAPPPKRSEERPAPPPNRERRKKQHHPEGGGRKAAASKRRGAGKHHHPKEGRERQHHPKEEEAKHHNPEGERRDKHPEGVGEGSTTPKKDRKAPPSKQRIGTEHRQGAGGGTTFTFTLLNCVGLGVSCRRSAFSSCPCCCLFLGPFSCCRHAPLKNDQFSSATKVENEQFQHHWCCVVCVWFFLFRFVSLCCVVL